MRLRFVSLVSMRLVDQISLVAHSIGIAGVHGAGLYTAVRSLFPMLDSSPLGLFVLNFTHSPLIC